MESQYNTDLTLFVPDLRGGGAERVMVNLASGFSERGYRVDLLLVKAAGPFLDEVSEQVRVVELGTRRAGFSLPALGRYVRTSGTSTVISALHHTNLAALFAKRVYDLPARLIVTLHNTLSVERENRQSLKGRLKHKLVAYCYRWADAIVAVSNEVADDFSAITNLPREAMSTIYNPVITPILFSKAAESVSHPWLDADDLPVILAVGRLHPQKDFATLLHAFRVVASARPVRLIILGEGEERPYLESLIDELDLRGRVDLPGFVNNPFAYLKRAKAFVLSSRWEGLPTVLIEALALGVPIVSTDCKSGPKEILAGGRLGELVPVGNQKALAEAILRALDKPHGVADDTQWKRYTKEYATLEYLHVAGLEK